MSKIPTQADPLSQALALTNQRRERFKRESAQRTLGQELGMMGALGWLVVTPPLLLAVLGRWLDALLGCGPLITALGLVAGVVIGGRMAWRRMNQETQGK
ncbi:ATP synthase protein I [uncultured Gammaproteobacteria bacterium]